jgi:hypothetical protein
MSVATASTVSCVPCWEETTMNMGLIWSRSNMGFISLSPLGRTNRNPSTSLSLSPPSPPVVRNPSRARPSPRDHSLAMAAENYWRYAEARQQQQQAMAAAAAGMAPAQTLNPAHSVAAAAAMNPQAAAMAQQAAAPPLKRARPGFGGSRPLVSLDPPFN